MKNCMIEALVTMDNRGQNVIPKEVRRIADIRDGDKLVVITHAKEGEPCYIFLVKAGTFIDEYMSTNKGGILKWV